MAILKTICQGVTIAKNKIADTTQNIIDKNHKNAQLNSLRSVMKRENETIYKAYQALGKIYYEKMTDSEKEENQLFCDIIEKSQARLEKAHQRYISIAKSTPTPVNEKKEKKIPTAKSTESVTVACSNEKEYSKEAPHIKEEICDDVTVKDVAAKEEIAEEDSF